MKPRTLSLVSLGLSILLVGMGTSYLKKIAVKQGKDNRWKVTAAFEELGLVFPTYFKLKGGSYSPEPDLASIIETLNRTQAKVPPTRLEKKGNTVELVPYEPMRYRLGSADAQWEMVLNYEKEIRQVKAEAYGVDPSAPISTRLYPCCHW